MRKRLQKSTQSKDEDLDSLEPYAGATRILSSSSSTSQNDWMIDSCASHHMTGNRGAFASYKSLNPNISVNPTHGHKGRPIGIGSVTLQLEGGELTLENVKHIPTLPTNIISLGQLVGEGYRLGGSTPEFNQHLTFSSPDGREFRAELADNDVFRLRSRIAISNTENKAPPMILLSFTPVPDPRARKRRGRPPNNRDMVKKTTIKKNSIPNTASDVDEIDDPGIGNSKDNWIRPAKHHEVYAAETKNVSCLGRSPKQRGRPPNNRSKDYERSLDTIGLD